MSLLRLAFEILEVVSCFIWEYWWVRSHRSSKGKLAELLSFLDTSVTCRISTSVFPVFSVFNLVHSGWKLNIYDKNRKSFYCVVIKTLKPAGGDKWCIINKLTYQSTTTCPLDICFKWKPNIKIIILKLTDFKNRNRNKHNDHYDHLNSQDLCRSLSVYKKHWGEWSLRAPWAWVFYVSIDYIANGLHELERCKLLYMQEFWQLWLLRV